MNVAEDDFLRVGCFFEWVVSFGEPVSFSGFIQDMFSFVNMLASVTLDNGAQFLNIHLCHYTAVVNV